MTEKNPRVLIAIPYHEAKRYCLSKLMDYVNNITYDNCEVIMRFDNGEYGRENAAKGQREYFRQLALDRGFDYLYFLGADTIPPVDVIERMLARDVDIVGGVYWGRHNASNGTPEGAVAWIHGSSMEYQREQFLSDRFMAIDGMGMDCVLFSRKVFEQISWLQWDQNDDDYPYYDAAKKLGFQTYIDCSIQCKHYFSEEGYAYRAEAFNYKLTK